MVNKDFATLNIKFNFHILCVLCMCLKKLFTVENKVLEYCFNLFNFSNETLESCSCYSNIYPAAAAAKSLQSCPTLCDPIDGNPPGFPIPEILQGRMLEWVAISFSNA